MAELVAAVKNALALKNTLLRRQEVERTTGLSRSAIYARLQEDHPQYDPSFPRPVPMGGPTDSPTCVRWVASEVEAYVEARIQSRDAAKSSR